MEGEGVEFMWFWRLGYDQARKVMQYPKDTPPEFLKFVRVTVLPSRLCCQCPSTANSGNAAVTAAFAD